MQRFTFNVLATTLFTLAAIPLVGCGTQSSVEQSSPADVSAPPPTVGDSHDEHLHEGQAGPHGGEIIELGHEHQLHAEMVEDDPTRSITIYVLDGELNERPIEQPSIRMSLLVKGKAQQFELQAVDPVERRASKFTSTSDDIFAALHDHHATGKLLINVDGKSYSGSIKHREHDEHDHP